MRTADWQKFVDREWILAIGLPLVDCMTLTRANFRYERFGRLVDLAELTAEQLAHFAEEEKRILTEHAHRSGLCFLAVALPVNGAFAVAYAGNWRSTSTLDITSYELFRKWSEAFANDHGKAIEHKAAREKWRAERALGSRLPPVFIEKSEADYYKPVVRQILAANIGNAGVTEQLLRNLLAVQKRLRAARGARG